MSAGGTREPIDPVRYLGNRSSGRQGVAVARAAADRGARVTLVAAHLDADVRPDPRVEVIAAGTAEELGRAMDATAPDADVIVMAAAVADYSVAAVADAKIRKQDSPGRLTLDLVENRDIVAGLVAAVVPARRSSPSRPRRSPTTRNCSNEPARRSLEGGRSARRQRGGLDEGVRNGRQRPHDRRGGDGALIVGDIGVEGRHRSRASRCDHRGATRRRRRPLNARRARRSAGRPPAVWRTPGTRAGSDALTRDERPGRRHSLAPTPSAVTTARGRGRSPDPRRTGRASFAPRSFRGAAESVRLGRGARFAPRGPGGHSA